MEQKNQAKTTNDTGKQFQGYCLTIVLSKVAKIPEVIDKHKRINWEAKAESVWFKRCLTQWATAPPRGILWYLHQILFKVIL